MRETVTDLLKFVDTAELVRPKVPFALVGENLNDPNSFNTKVLGLGPVDRGDV